MSDGTIVVACSSCRTQRRLPVYMEEGYPFDSIPATGSTVGGIGPCPGEDEHGKHCSDLYEVLHLEGVNRGQVLGKSQDSGFIEVADRRTEGGSGG